MNNNTVARVAAIAFGLLMIIFSINHFKMDAAMDGAVPSYLPAPTFFVYLTGAGLVLAGIAIIINIKSRLAGYLLGLMLVLIALMIHLPPVVNGSDNGMHYPHLLKDLG